MQDLKELLETAPDNQTIRNTFIKANVLLDSYKNPVVSVSGGSDSDVMLDVIERVRGSRKVFYVFFNTGIEYRATLRHLDYLEERYGIQIDRRRAVIPVGAGCRKYGVPFLSKRASQCIENLQKNGFKWEDEDFETLYKRYPHCKSGLTWWCRQTQYNQMSIPKIMKAFMIQNPPTFRISDNCCEGAKKRTAKQYDKEVDAYICCIGERKAEGGNRAIAHKSCFDIKEGAKPQKYHPLYFWTDEDKREYEEHYGIVHSDCYTVYGLKRTGCFGCPFNSRWEEETAIIQQYEPQLYAAAQKIFGDAYEYSRKYKAFAAQYKRGKKSEADPQQIEPLDCQLSFEEVL